MYETVFNIKIGLEENLITVTLLRFHKVVDSELRTYIVSSGIFDPKRIRTSA